MSVKSEHGGGEKTSLHSKLPCVLVAASWKAAIEELARKRKPYSSRDCYAVAVSSNVAG